MRKHIVQITVLTMLVILCMWQIVTLWLGNMSSHNFLGKNNTEQNIILVQPKAMWVNGGKLAYKIEESNNEYNMLINELSSLIVSNVKRSSIEKDNTISYKQLLGMPTLLYEYGMGFGIEELVGVKIDNLQEDEDIIINQVFIDMSNYSDYATNLYLISENVDNIYKVTLYNRLEGHQKILESFNDTERTNSLISYQPSITSDKKEYIKGNNFLPYITKKVPLEYDVLRISNPYEDKAKKEKMEMLEADINSFFANPLLKEKEERSDGSIIFSEKMRATVKYMPVGTLEFNITSANEETNLTEVERLTKVMAFIKECTGIPKFLKRGIYLRNRVNLGGEYIYQFDYKYRGFGVQLKQEVKEKLGLESILQITVKNNQVVSGKWSILDISEFDETKPLRDQVLREYGEIVETMYERYMKNANETTQLDTVQCKYIMADTSGQMKLDWTVFYQNKWYYP